MKSTIRLTATGVVVDGEKMPSNLRKDTLASALKKILFGKA